MSGPRAVFAAWIALACAAGFSGSLRAQSAPGRKTAPATAPTAAKRKPATAPAPVSPEERRVRAWMASLNTRDLAAQLIIITTYGEALPARSRLYQQYVRWVRDLHVGGLIVVNRVAQGSVRYAEPVAMASFFNRMQRLARIPLMVGADFERGASMRVANTIRFPHQMAFGAADDPKLTAELARATAREARALGVQWVFAPVADVNNNPDNPVINIRSFGEDPQLVARHVEAYIEGARSDPENRVLVTVKHFPGHGDTADDSHAGLPTLSTNRQRMDQVELVPFRAAVAKRVDAVMTAHIAVPEVTGESVPSTVSPAILTDLLRKEMGFSGLIVTDAMEMRGFSQQFSSGEGAVRALEAGADVLLMPPNPDQAVRAVAAAVQSGRLKRKRLEESVAKVLAAKVQAGLHRSKLVDLEAISDRTESPDSAAVAQQVADRAVTLVRNKNGLLPLPRSADAGGACLFVLAEGRYNNQQGRAMIAEAQQRAPQIRTALLDPVMPTVEMDEVLRQHAGCKQNIAAAFVSVSSARGNIALSGNLTYFVEALQKSEAPLALIALGNPYLLRAFPGVAAYMATFTTVPVAETAAVKALFGEIFPSGKLPVTIPGVAKLGEGLSLPLPAR